MKTLGIVISTPGRRTLGRTLASIAYQKEGVEDVLVVGDGYDDPTRDLVEFYASEFKLPCRYKATTQTRDWGHTQLNYGLRNVRGDYVTYQDDDDIYLPRSIEEMVRLINEMAEPKPILGRVKTPMLGLLWQRPDESTCLDGHCLVAPNDKRKLGWMAPVHSGDQGFLHTTLRNYPEWAWTDRIWTLTRPTWPMETYECSRDDHSWLWSFADAQDSLLNARLFMTKDPEHDRMFARVLWRRRDLLPEEYRQIAEFAVYACQGNDCWFRVDPRNDGSMIDGLYISNYKQHTHDGTEWTHDWPPDFWPPLAPFDHVVNPDTKEKLDDYRDDVWGGRPVS